MSKLVFSIKKYANWLKETMRYNDEQVEKDIQRWPSQCEGKTNEEMKNIGCATTSAWMVEVDDGQGN